MVSIRAERERESELLAGFDFLGKGGCPECSLERGRHGFERALDRASLFRKFRLANRAYGDTESLETGGLKVYSPAFLMERSKKMLCDVMIILRKKMLVLGSIPSLFTTIGYLR